MIVLLFKKHWPALTLIIITINIALSAFWLLNGEIHYDIDISRDFLVLDEAVTTKQPFLIGPRSGAIPGVFHGPLWHYLNLPAFIITNGNPLLIGWFWWLLSIAVLLLFGWVTKCLFNYQTALLSMLLYSVNSIINPAIGLKQFFNPYGATALSPLFYYLSIKYIQSHQWIYLLLSLFCLGLIIQFQMAFGVPVLIISSLFFIYYTFTRKLLKHLFCFLILLIPLSTFMIFDLRNNFLQLNSLLNFLQQSRENINIYTFLLSRLKSILTDVYLMLMPDNTLLALTCSFLFLFIIMILKKYRQIYYSFFLLLYFGFWMFLFIFKGSPGNYFWPFLPVIIMLFSSFYNFLPKKVFLFSFTLLVGWNFFIGISFINNFNFNINKRGVDSWGYNQSLADYIYRDANQEFGYFIFTPDRWGFNQNYAMRYMQKNYPDKKSYPFIKKKLTYLIIVDPPKDRPDIDPLGWKISDLKINQENQEKIKLDVTEIQKYYLTDEELSAPTNPYLLNSTFFR